MKNKLKVLPFAVLSTGIVSIYGYGEINETYAKENEVAVQILGINDLHGQIEGTGSVYEYGQRAKERAGSAPILATYLDKAEAEFKAEKAEDAVSTRVQAGDMVGASPAVSGLLQDEPTIKALNEMKFEIGTLGNHEFDEGLEEYNRIINGEAPKSGEFNSAVETYNREKSNMEIVIANVVEKGTDKVPFNWQPYTIKEYTDSEKETAKIGYIGVVTEEIPTLVLKKHWENFDILDPATTINKYAKLLKEKGVNAIVVLAHASATTPSDNATEVGGEVKNIIDKLDADSSVDIIFAGHNHVIANGTYKGIRVVEGAAQGKAVANVVGIYDTTTNDFKEVSAKVTPTFEKIDGVAVEKNPTLVKLASDANDAIKEIVSAKVAEATETITRTTDAQKDAGPNTESPIGNVITDGQLWAAKKAGYDANFAITNNGGIRADLEVVDGVVTWGAAQKVQPFGNVMQVISISGKDLIATLNSQYNAGEKYFLQMSGIKYTYKKAPEGTVDEKGNPVNWVVDQAWIVKEDGTAELIKEDTNYIGVINDFLYGGGDDFPELKGQKLLGALDPDTEIFVNYLKHLGNIKTPNLDRKLLVVEGNNDNDGDGVDNPTEIAHGTDINSAESFPKLNVEGSVGTNGSQSPLTTGTPAKESTIKESADSASQKDSDKEASAMTSNKKLPNTGLTSNYGLALVSSLGLILLASRLRKFKK